MRDIFWKVIEERGGPDHMFVAHFEPGDAARLPQLVRDFPLSGFKVCDIVFDEAEPRSAETVILVDEHTYAKLLAQRDSGQRENIYISTSVEVKEHRLFVHAGYGGLADARELVAMLAQSTEVTLRGWEVWSYGYGPPSDRIYAQHSGGAALLKYLHGELPPEPPTIKP